VDIIGFPFDGLRVDPIGLGDPRKVGMRVVVDWDECESQGACVQQAPEVFEVREADDKMYVLDGAPSESLREKVTAAVNACPKAALRLEG
jgi:ferredoxin